jgi:hypothetical protein
MGNNSVHGGFYICASDPDYVIDPYVTLGEWHHLVYMQDATGGKIYVNNQLVLTPPQYLSPYAYGGDFYSYFGNNPQECNIDQLEIYNRALTDDEVTALYNQERR